ncbi:hypothetical protein [Archaeoglobus sp.]
MYTKLILRPLLGGLLFGFFLGLCLWCIFKSFVVGMLIWLAFGGSFGLFMATFNVIMAKRLTKKYGNYEWMKTHHEREIILSMPYEDAFELCLRIVKSLNRCRVREMNKERGRITAVRYSKFLSWRYCTQITIDLKRINENETLIKISSKPRYNAYNFDFGENLENVEEILLRLRSFQNEKLVKFKRYLRE